MVFSATGTVRKTWPAAENSSVFRPLLHRRHRTIASATGNSLDRICCNARSARKVRCGGLVFSRPAPQPPHGTAHERRYQATPVLAEASCRPGPCRSLSRFGIGSAKRGLHRSRNALFPGLTPRTTHPARFSRLYSLPTPTLSRSLLQYRDLPKHIARGVLQRLSTTGF